MITLHVVVPNQEKELHGPYNSVDQALEELEESISCGDFTFTEMLAMGIEYYLVDEEGGVVYKITE